MAQTIEELKSDLIKFFTQYNNSTSREQFFSDVQSYLEFRRVGLSHEVTIVRMQEDE